MKDFLILALVVLAAVQNIPERLFISSPKPEYRQLIRLQNHRRIEAHNANSKRSYTMKLYDNFAILTHEERQAIYLIPQRFMKKGSNIRNVKEGPSFFERTFSSENINVNWTARGKVSSVKNQGNCGSCYAYSALADIESTFLFKGVAVDLSEQQIIDCSMKFGNEGCNGGLMSIVFQYVKLLGVANATTYPDNEMSFLHSTEGLCKHVTKNQLYKIRNFHATSLYKNDCSSLTKIVKGRPVSIAIAVNDNFFYYQTGVMDGCDDTQTNHGVLMTGIFQNENENYWIAKNSWGSDWGENGSMRIDRKRYNHCRVCQEPYYSTL